VKLVQLTLFWHDSSVPGDHALLLPHVYSAEVKTGDGGHVCRRVTRTEDRQSRTDHDDDGAVVDVILTAPRLVAKGTL
jgi:hypothetical protein